MNLKYQSGFRNHFSSEALSGALPQNQNSPKKAPMGLYAEQISGNAFTAPREQNLKTWFYRLKPSVELGRFERVAKANWKSGPFSTEALSPSPLRWGVLYRNMAGEDFVQSLWTVAGNGAPLTQHGLSIHVYSTDTPMRHRFVQNAEGEMLFVPQVGQHVFKTEMGWIFAEPGEIVVIPRGIKFQLDPVDGFAKGYICENFGPSFRLPELGPIGSNGLAHPRHFLSPEARFEDQEGDFELLVRFNGQLWNAQLKHHPLDVVAWHGNYAPYKYDLRLFNTINTVSFDHPDPSIFTVLTSPTDTHGVANCDFVIFPPRWMVAENTFRPPYFHRNFASEWMGLVYGEYDAKAEHASGGFVPGGASLHNAMTAHGPDATTFNKAIEAPEGPQKIDKTLAFMFESRYVFVPTDLALKSAALQKNYQDCWQGFTKYFKPETVSKK